MRAEKVFPFGGDVTHHTELSCRGATCGRPHPLRGRLHALRGRPQLRRGRPLPLRFKPQPLRFTTAAAVCAAASSAWQAAAAAWQTASAAWQAASAAWQPASAARQAAAAAWQAAAAAFAVAPAESKIGPNRPSSGFSCFKMTSLGGSRFCEFERVGAPLRKPLYKTNTSGGFLGFQGNALPEVGSEMEKDQNDTYVCVILQKRRSQISPNRSSSGFSCFKSLFLEVQENPF